MYPLYKDLKTRLGKPLWYDMHGVPRYDEFTPKDAAEIYGEAVALQNVRCQACGKVFRCARASGLSHIARMATGDLSAAMAMFREDPLHFLAGWGDAPWHDADGDECGFDSQCAGTTMSTDSRVIELWVKDKSKFEWLQVYVPDEYRRYDEEPE